MTTNAVSPNQTIHLDVQITVKAQQNNTLSKYLFINFLPNNKQIQLKTSKKDDMCSIKAVESDKWMESTGKLF